MLELRSILLLRDGCLDIVSKEWGVNGEEIEEEEDEVPEEKEDKVADDHDYMAKELKGEVTKQKGTGVENETHSKKARIEHKR